VNFLDWVLLGVLLFFVALGYRKGFLAQLLQILAIVGSFVVASRFYLALAENALFEGMRQRSATAAQVTAWVVLFFVAGAILSVVASAIARRFQNEHLKAGDRWLGALFSSAKGVVLLGGIALGLQEWKFPAGTALPADDQKTAEGLVTSSLLVPRLADACFVLVDMIPPQQRAELRKMVDERRLHFDRPAGSGGALLVAPEPAGPSRGSAPGPAAGSVGGAGDEPEATGARDPAPVLLPLGELRRLTLREREGAAVPVPAAARIDADADPGRPSSTPPSGATPRLDP